MNAIVGKVTLIRTIQAIAIKGRHWSEKVEDREVAHYMNMEFFIFLEKCIESLETGLSFNKEIDL